MTDSRVLRGLLVGAVAGAVGTFAMNLFGKAVARAKHGSTTQREDEVSARGGRPDVSAGQERAHRSGQHQTDATVKVATAVTEPLLGRNLSDEDQHQAAMLFHYGYGIATAAAYGILCEYFRVARVAMGVPFGLVVWFVAVQNVLPAMRLMPPPKTYAARHHLFAIGSHITYGLTTELMRRALRRAA